MPVGQIVEVEIMAHTHAFEAILNIFSPLKHEFIVGSRAPLLKLANYIFHNSGIWHVPQ
jgi:hypothetical protein